ncbi:butyrophilin subfamily 2 member A2-like isoform X2 [Oncorhynchus mykiss]|uniref:butyrophilin subfamily 2 member A2-like isoform X2 n=1 Tax=Oncorhynchus mykiss TaxID=8022 RepID=UPI001877C961|nr:butyrophilin subfamily 2 member A2-like isoform X2 [Oncorhynchus mykiss]
METGPDSLFLTLLLLLHSSHSVSERFEVLGPSDSIVAVAGDDIILPCYLKPNISAEDMTVDWLNLDFLDGRVFRYQNHRIIREDQILFYSGRTSLYEEELWRGNTSLKLTRVQGTDEGRYKCLIQSKSWYDDFTVQVLVKAVGSKPVVSIEGHREGGMGLLCETEGWHPEPELVWLDSKGVHLSAGPPEIDKDSKGFYTVKQHVIVQETDTNRFTCRVQQSQINEKMETEIHLPIVGSKPVVSIEGHRGGGMGLLCETEGWHPEPELVWLDSKGVNLSAGPPEIDKDSKGFYTVKQHVIVQETDTNRFTCRVQQSRINEKMEMEIHLPSELFDTTPWRISFIVLCCLGAITVIGLSLAIYCIRNKKDDLTRKLVNLGDQNYELWEHKYYLTENRDVLRKEKDFETIRRHAVDVTLDPDTAHCKLILSDDGKQVRHGELDQVLSDNGKRFTNWSCVLGNVGFSGKFYYEVKVEGKTEWTLGVVIQSINRNESFIPMPNNGYWTVELKDGECTANADSPVTFTPREGPLKVGVFVDYEKGQVSFYNVEDRSHIYSFTGCSFTEKLHPFFNPGGSDSIPLVVCPVDATD